MIVASRTAFTAEVNMAFDQMEEGQSDALQVFCVFVRGVCVLWECGWVGWVWAGGV